MLIIFLTTQYYCNVLGIKNEHVAWSVVGFINGSKHDHLSQWNAKEGSNLLLLYVLCVGVQHSPYFQGASNNADKAESFINNFPIEKIMINILIKIPSALK